ncbi:MAG: hypothetical protein IK114_12670 [Fibrobacter sp.]|nr:hypothetical protein [Fibrobacter sp.]
MMNIFKEKKEYEAPKLSILDMRGEFSLLAGSGDGPDADDYDDELGFNLGGDVNRHA